MNGKRIAIVVGIAVVAVGAVVVVMAQTPPAVQWPVPVAQDPAIAAAAQQVAAGAQASALSLQIIGLLTLIFQGGFVAFGSWMVFKQRKVDLALEVAKVEAKKSADTLELGQQEAKIVADKTHTLVNSNYGVQLRLVATALRRLAETSHKPADEAEAAEAKALYDDHVKQQAVVDATAAAKS